MAEPLHIDPLQRIVDVRRAMLHGLVEPIGVSGGGGINRFYPRGGAAWTTDKVRLGALLTEFQSKPPGVFTGEMRKVVQDNYARGISCIYSSTFALSHGIWTAPDGGKHVVEIGSGGAYTWPLRTRTYSGPMEFEIDSLDYVPMQTDRPDSPRQIATSGDLSTWYAMSPLYAGCGWAFSASGAQAAIVLLTTSGSYYRSRFVTLTITGDNTGPLSLSGAESEEDYMWWNASSVFAKVPKSDNSGVVAFRAYTSVVQPSSNFKGPLHIWFEGETAKKVYVVKRPSTTVTNSLPDPQASNATNSVTGSLGSWYTETRTEDIFGFESPPGGAPNQYSSFDRTDYSRFIFFGPELCWSSFYCPAELASVIVRADRVTYSGLLFNDIVVIPPFDREAVSHYRDEVRVDRMETRNYSGVDTGILGDSYTCASAGGACGHSAGCAAAEDPPTQQDTLSFAFAPDEYTSAQPLIGCDPYDLLFCGEGATNYLSFAPTDSFSSFPSPILVRQSFAWLNEANRTLTSDADSGDTWRHYDEDNPQIIVSCPDAAGRGQEIWSVRLHPAGGAYAANILGENCDGGPGYPVEDIVRADLSFIGNP